MKEVFTHGNYVSSEDQAAQERAWLQKENENR